MVIQDFLGEDEVFVPFNGVGDSSLEQDKEKYQYSYEDIIEMLQDNQYRLSPVFDNGSSLFPQLNTDEKIEAVLRDQEEIDMRIYKFPTLQVKYKGKKSSYYEIISSLAFEECNQALIRIVERIDFNKINKLIDSVENISEKRIEFYKTILEQRYEKILLKSYNELMQK